jgi:hypothetical protein
MNFEDDFLQRYLTGQGIQDMDPTAFQGAMKGLIEKGLVQILRREDGKAVYTPTPLLKQIKRQQNSDHKQQN